MNRSSHTRFLFCITAIPIAVIGCASIPDVETRLQSLELGPNTYVARPGDTFETVAFRYRLEPEQLVALNPHLSAGMNAGDRVVVHQFDTVAARSQYGPAPAELNGAETTQASRFGAGQSINSQSVASGAIKSTPVTVQPNGNRVESVLIYPTQSVSPAQAAESYREIPANAQNTGNARLPIEEVVLDEFDDGLSYSSLPAVSEQQLAAANAPDSVLSAPSGNSISAWVWPTLGEVARDFAPSEAGGQGIDIAGVPGQQIHAASNGTVAYAGRELSGGNGKLIILQHDNGLMTTYSHANQLFVVEDDVVNAGDVIASLGSNARNESVLRFEVRQNGNPLNPMNFLTN